VDELARRALLALVNAPQALFDSGVGGAGVNKGQTRAMDSRCSMFEAMPRPSTGSHLCGEGARKTVDLAVVLAEGTNGNDGGDPQLRDHGGGCGMFHFIDASHQDVSENGRPSWTAASVVQE
jgi:hypothetical protein